MAATWNRYVCSNSYRMRKVKRKSAEKNMCTATVGLSFGKRSPAYPDFSTFQSTDRDPLFRSGVLTSLPAHLQKSKKSVLLRFTVSYSQHISKGPPSSGSTVRVNFNTPAFKYWNGSHLKKWLDG